MSSKYYLFLGLALVVGQAILLPESSQALHRGPFDWIIEDLESWTRPTPTEEYERRRSPQAPQPGDGSEIPSIKPSPKPFDSCATDPELMPASDCMAVRYDDEDELELLIQTIAEDSQ